MFPKVLQSESTTVLLNTIEYQQITYTSSTETLFQSIFDGIMDSSCINPNVLFKKSSRRLLIDKNKRNESGWLSPPHVTIDYLDEPDDDLTESVLFVKTKKNEEPTKFAEHVLHATDSAGSMSKDSTQESSSDATSITR